LSGAPYNQWQFKKRAVPFYSGISGACQNGACDVMVGWMPCPEMLGLKGMFGRVIRMKIFSQFSGCIQTLELRIVSQLFYHCVTKQLFVEPFVVLCCNDRLIIALPPYIMLEMHDES
jgi:hypothetical protein